MIPLKDNIPSRTFPIVNYSLIAVCALVFIGQLAQPSRDEVSVEEQFGMIPQRVFHPDEPVTMRESVRGRYEVTIVERTAAETPFNPWLTLFTCIFLHGGWLHFAGNMWFLHIFGDNVEDRFGHVGYGVFYLCCGVAASAVHLITNAASPVPTIGASGAIAGVMGAYFLLYPRAKVVSLMPLWGFVQIFVLPAPVFLGIWFAFQFFQGAITITSLQTGGVAWWAHIGGFAAGFATAAILKSIGGTSPPVESVQPNTDRTRSFRYYRD